MRLCKQIAGVVLIILGFLALVTPFTPGAWLMFVGLGLLGVVLEVSEDHRYASWLTRIGFKIKKKIEEVKEDL